MQTATLSAKDRRDVIRRQNKFVQGWLTGDRANRSYEPGGLRVQEGDLIITLDEEPVNYRMQSRALSAQIGFEGAYGIPQTMQENIEIALQYHSAVRDWATVVRTNHGGEFKWPTMNDTANSASILPENGLVGNSVNIQQVGQLQLLAQKYGSAILVPYELLEDAVPVLAAYIGRALGERVSRGQNTSFTAKVLSSATEAFQAASPTAIAGDEIVNMYHSLDPAYRGLPSCCWQMSNAILEYVRKLKDAQGRYLFYMPEQPGEVETLMGKPVVCNRDMTSVLASGVQSILFGPFEKVIVRDVREVRVVQSSERFAEYDQQLLAVYLRSDCSTMDAGQHPIQYLQH